MKQLSRKDYGISVRNEQVYYKKSYKNWIIGVIYGHERYYEGKYLYHYRWAKYYSRKRGGAKLLCFYHKARMNYYSYKTGMQLGMSDVGWGVKIHHWGSIVINGNVKVGENLTIYPGVTIGQTAGDKNNVPVIGNNVFIYPNAIIYGKIIVGNNVTILANSVVTHDVPDNTIVGGIPAKIIRHILY